MTWAEVAGLNRKASRAGIALGNSPLAELHGSSPDGGLLVGRSGE